MTRILVVEDEPKLLRSLERRLSREGFEVTGVEAGDEGYRLASNEPFDALILDLMLPGRDGLEIVRLLRTRGFSQPILILTARDAIDDRVAGLDSGADDYLVKPFSYDELLARLRALLRRGSGAISHVLSVGDLQMDLLRRRVTRAGVELGLTQREFEVLEYLLRRQNTTVSREMMASDVWKNPSAAVMTNVIDVCINGLRRKVTVPGTRPLIYTIRGVGYELRSEE